MCLCWCFNVFVDGCLQGLAAEFPSFYTMKVRSPQAEPVHTTRCRCGITTATASCAAERKRAAFYKNLQVSYGCCRVFECPFVTKETEELAFIWRVTQKVPGCATQPVPHQQMHMCVTITTIPSDRECCSPVGHTAGIQCVVPWFSTGHK